MSALIELFACSGGLAAGFRAAGLTFDMAFDRDPDACASYEANLGQRPIRLDVRDLLRMRWNPGPIDLIVADPPCAPWSRAGKKRGLADGRDMLAVTVELIADLRPRAYLVGNIPGLEDAPNRATVQRLIGGLARHGYCAKDFAVLDAADYGVPQRRPRPYWYGHLGGPCIEWPARTHCDPAVLNQRTLPGHDPLLPWVTCKEALGHLPLKDLGRPIRMRKRACKGKQHGSVMERPARVVGTSNTRPATTVHADPRLAPPGAHDQSWLSAKEWPWDRPATTLDTRDVLAPPGRNGRAEERGHSPQPQRAHADAIVLSERAAAILQGFPAGWTFAGKTKAARWAQLGQAVPLRVAIAIALSVRRAMAGQNRRVA